MRRHHTRKEGGTLANLRDEYSSWSWKSQDAEIYDLFGEFNGEPAESSERESGERERQTNVGKSAQSEVRDSRSVSLLCSQRSLRSFPSLAPSSPSPKSLDYYVVSGHGLSSTYIFLPFIPQLPPFVLLFSCPASPFSVCTSRSITPALNRLRQLAYGQLSLRRTSCSVSSGIEGSFHFPLTVFFSSFNPFGLVLLRWTSPPPQ